MNARIFITGSSDGLGQMAARTLIERGHEVILHARNPARAADAMKALPGAKGCVVGDIETIAANREAAEQINALGVCDVIIHNAAVGYQEPERRLTADGLPHLFAINVLSPYLLTALIHKPKRMMYLSSGLHHTAGTSLDDLLWEKRAWDGTAAYSESKFQDVLLAFAMARRWPDVWSNALEPGWVPTKMGGPSAPDDLALGPITQVWLAEGTDPAARKTGTYYRFKEVMEPHPATRAVALQDELLRRCAQLSGVEIGN